MGTGVLAEVLRYVRVLAAPEESDLDDGELLRRFVERRDEEAFAALLGRHGPLVLGVCRRILGDEQDAEDAFQATFLVLARKAVSIRRQKSLAAWLHRVALNISQTARIGIARRKTHEKQAALLTQPSGAEDLVRRDWLSLVHEEVDRLPEKYRVPVVLCYFEGKTHEEAARELSWPLGTVKGRLARARDLLRTRLARRGLTLTGTGIATILLESLAAAAVPPTLLALTLRSSASFAVGAAVEAATPRALALVDETSPAMSATKLFHAVSLLLVVGAITCALVAGTPSQGQRDPFSSPISGTSPPKPENSTKLDAAGDPLPLGAVARLGTVRFRHAGDVTTVVHFPDGKTLASGSIDGTVRLWHAAPGQEIRRLSGDHVILAPDARTWATWTAWKEPATDTKITLWDVATGKQLRVFERRGQTDTVTFSPDSKVLAAGGVNAKGLNQLSLWEVATGKELPAPQMGGKYDYVHHLGFSPDGKLLATAGETNSRVDLWDLATGKEVDRFRAPGGGDAKVFAPFAFSPDGKTFVSAGKELDSGQVDPAIYLWDVATGKELRRFEGLGGGGCSAIKFSPAGETLVSAHGGSVCVWEAGTGKLLHTLQGHPENVNCLSLSRDGKVLASGSQDHTLRLWNLATGKPTHPCPGHQGEVTSVALSPDGKTVISAGWDRTIRLWDLATGKETRRLVDQAPVCSIALAPGGKLLASRSRVLAGTA